MRTTTYTLVYIRGGTLCVHTRVEAAYIIVGQVDSMVKVVLCLYKMLFTCYTTKQSKG